MDNNYAGDIDESDTPPELFVLRRAAAYQAYYEAMPLRASALPSGSHMRIYRRLQFGSLIDLSVLDTRQWRSDQPCGDGIADRLRRARSRRRSTMMGDEQERWLFDNLATVKARWTVIGQQVYSFALRSFEGAIPTASSRWTSGTATSRRGSGCTSGCCETQAPNPIVLSGDVHQHYGADLKMDFTDPRSADGRRRVHQLVDDDDRRRQRRRGRAWEATRADNPHIKYHSNRRGYIACTATPACRCAPTSRLSTR